MHFSNSYFSTDPRLQNLSITFDISFHIQLLKVTDVAPKCLYVNLKYSLTWRRESLKRSETLFMAFNVTASCLICGGGS